MVSQSHKRLEEAIIKTPLNAVPTSSHCLREPCSESESKNGLNDPYTLHLGTVEINTNWEIKSISF